MKGPDAPKPAAATPLVYATGAQTVQKRQSQLLQASQSKGLSSTQLAPRPAGQLLGQNGGIS